MSNETNRMMDFCENIREQIAKIQEQCSDLKLELESIGDDVFEKYPEQEDIWNNIQFCISYISSAKNYFNKASGYLNDVYDDIHYNEFEEMKE